MKRAPLALFTAALAGALAWPVSHAIGAAASEGGEPRVCRHMTTERILENPALADEWAQAVRSAQPEAIARLRALFAEIRAAHGCGGEIGTPPPGRAGTLLPPGHPPIHGVPELPPGHPPIPSSPRAPLFETPALLTI